MIVSHSIVLGGTCCSSCRSAIRAATERGPTSASVDSECSDPTVAVDCRRFDGRRARIATSRPGCRHRDGIAAAMAPAINATARPTRDRSLPDFPTPSICSCFRSEPDTYRHRPSVRSAPFLPPAAPAVISVGRPGHCNGRSVRRRPRPTASAIGPIAQPLVDSLSAADRYGLPLAPVLERLSLKLVNNDGATRCRGPRAARAPRPSTGAVHAAVVRTARNRSLAPRSPVVAAHLTTTEVSSTERGSP